MDDPRGLATTGRGDVLVIERGRLNGDGDTGDDWPYRPVDLATGSSGQLLISSDADVTLLCVGYDGM